MKHKILSLVGLFSGSVEMPKNFEIDRDKLLEDILRSVPNNFDFPFSKTWDMLETYIRERFNVEYGIKLVHKKTFGGCYKSNEISQPLLNVDPVDLRHSPDFTLLYGVKTDKCMVRIFYDDNRRKGRSWDIELKNNEFIMFPSTNTYVISNNQKDSLNSILTITYEYI
jgi:hypothetical protein|tara:strand:- start:80 stop:583 length:504 start_codon:yes stop_codon:yes gene_type:complete